MPTIRERLAERREVMHFVSDYVAKNPSATKSEVSAAAKEKFGERKIDPETWKRIIEILTIVLNLFFKV